MIHILVISNTHFSQVQGNTMICSHLKHKPWRWPSSVGVHRPHSFNINIGNGKMMEVARLITKKKYLWGHPPVSTSFCSHNSRLSFDTCNTKISNFNSLQKETKRKARQIYPVLNLVQQKPILAPNQHVANYGKRNGSQKINVFFKSKCIEGS